ncbi:type I restriction enzyme S subunit [Fontibacillus solani]|uniref:Type I restriction enzyme S subunit n=1 Tax=Fontibacillus solani TaxID=1572857 RepID=A0A7W3SWJ9_9BACL|nr:restriction endonuclease subunit S [Fontibacillus solani]MBA9087263.1 type I restriction enzyme S subunit [Fontibacillus solani]
MEYKKIGDIAEVISGSTPKTTVDEYWDGNLPWITPAELEESKQYVDDTKRKLTELGVQSSSLRLLPKDTVLLTSRAPIGKVALTAIEMYCNQGFKNLVCNTDWVYPKYLYYWLSSKTDYLNSLGRGATFKEISKSIVEEIIVPLPKVEEQRKIAVVLDKAQGLIVKRKEQIKACDELEKALFYHIFGDPASNPMKWDNLCIRDIITEAKYGTSQKADEKNGEYPILRMNNITYEGNWDFTDLKYVDLEEKNRGNYLVSKGDLLFNRTNSKELVGKTAVYNEDQVMAYAGYLIRVRTNEKANTQYISSFLNSPYGKEKLRGMCKSIVGMANINAQELQDIRIPVPPRDLQEKFAEMIKKISGQRKLLQNGLTELEKNFNALMQRAFKGELF